MNQEELHDLIAKQQPNICQIVAYRNNERVYSDCWNDYKADDCTHIMSATKSVSLPLCLLKLSIRELKIDFKSFFKKKMQEKSAPYGTWNRKRNDPWSFVNSRSRVISFPVSRPIRGVFSCIFFLKKLLKSIFNSFMLSFSKHKGSDMYLWIRKNYMTW